MRDWLTWTRPRGLWVVWKKTCVDDISSSISPANAQPHLYHTEMASSSFSDLKEQQIKCIYFNSAWPLCRLYWCKTPLLTQQTLLGVNSSSELAEMLVCLFMSMQTFSTLYVNLWNCLPASVCVCVWQLMLVWSTFPLLLVGRVCQSCLGNDVSTCDISQRQRRT